MDAIARKPWLSVEPERLSKQFSRVGWIGFWMQFALLAVPLLLLAYVLLMRSPESAQRIGIDLSNYLSYGSLLVMVFTTFWFFRYTRVGKLLADPTGRPDRAVVEQTLWVGLWASGVGIAFSMFLLFSAAGRMLFVLLATPQTGLMLSPGLGNDPAQSISAMDAISLTSLLIILGAELMVLSLSAWLLFLATRSAPAAPATAA